MTTKTPEQIAADVVAPVQTYEDSAEEVGHPDGQPIIETFPQLLELLAEAARKGMAEAQRATKELLEEDVRAALEGDSNDAEHDALVSVADTLSINYRDPYDDEDDEDDEDEPAGHKCVNCGEYTEDGLMPEDGLNGFCDACVHNARRSGYVG